MILTPYECNRCDKQAMGRNGALPDDWTKIDGNRHSEDPSQQHDRHYCDSSVCQGVRTKILAAEEAERTRIKRTLTP